MILRCDAPRKRNRLATCDGFVGAAPDGARARRILHSKEAATDAYVMGCLRCGALYEVAPPLDFAA